MTLEPEGTAPTSSADDEPLSDADFDRALDERPDDDHEPDLRDVQLDPDEALGPG